MAPHVARGARACASAGAVADVADTVLVSLPTPDIVRAVAGELAQGDAIEAFIDLSTTGPEVAAEVAADPERGRRRLPRRAGERRRRRRAGRNADDHGRRRRGAVRRAAPAARGARAQRRARRRRARPGPAGQGPQQPALGQRDRDHRRGARARRARRACRRARCSTSSTRAAGATPRARTSSPGTCCRGPSAPASGSS